MNNFVQKILDSNQYIVHNIMLSDLVDISPVQICHTNQSLYVTESCHLTVITRTQNLSDRTQIHGFGAETRLQTGTAISLR